MQTINERFRAAILDFMHAPEYSACDSKTRARVFAEDYAPVIARHRLLDLIEMSFRAEERADVREAEKTAQAEDSQMRILGPGFAELFTSLHQRLPLKKGRRMFDLMTEPEFRQSAAAFRTKGQTIAARNTEIHERRANYLDGLADAMAPHSKARPALTFRDYRELVADGAIEPAPVAKTQRAGARR